MGERSGFPTISGSTYSKPSQPLLGQMPMMMRQNETLLDPMQRRPGNFLELHPEDANARGIESGDLVVAESNDILVQTGGFYGIEDDHLSFTRLMQNGHIKVGRGACSAIAVVTDALKPGVAWMYFLWPGSSANSLVHAVPDPITNRARFKLGKGRVRKIGESPYKHSFSTMSFAPRHII
jgi:arsenite oxidase large subunit